MDLTKFAELVDALGDASNWCLGAYVRNILVAALKVDHAVDKGRLDFSDRWKQRAEAHYGGERGAAVCQLRGCVGYFGYPAPCEGSLPRGLGSGVCAC